MARRPLALPPSAIDRWCQYVQGEVSHVAEATGFVNFELSFDAQQRRAISPQNYIITFPNRDKGRQRYHSSLLTLRLVPENSLPEQVQVGVEVRGRGGESVLCNGEYVEFELLSLVNDAAKQPPLRIASGPVRVNPETQQREFMRIDLGRCVRQIATDIIDDSKHKGQKLVRSRWWICVEVLRLVCSANSLDCSALDNPAAAPLEWVLCLVDEKSSAGGSGNSSGAVVDAKAPEEKSIDELAKFIDGGGKRSKARQRRKKAKGEDAGDDAIGLEHEDLEVGAEAATLRPGSFSSVAALAARAGESASAAAEAAALAAAPPQGPAAARTPQAPRVGAGAASPRPAPPPGWSRTVDLSSALIDIWHDSAGCVVNHVAESTGFVHFLLSFHAELRRRLVAPVHYVIAFPHVTAGQQRCHSALLTMHVVGHSEIPDDTEAESISFELLAREGEAPVHTPLRFTTGPVRVNDQTGQREFMRLDLGDCVRWAPPDVVEGVVNGSAQRLVRQRWWLSLETLRSICTGNSLDCSGLDSAGAPAIEWVACLVDDRTPSNNVAAGVRAGLAADQLTRLMSNLKGLPQATEKPKAKKKTKEEPRALDSPASGSASGACAKEEPRASGSPASGSAGGACAKEEPRASGSSASGSASGACAKEEPRASGSPASGSASGACAKEPAASSQAAPPVETRPSQERATSSTAEEDSAQSAESELPRQNPGKQPPPSRTLALPSALIDSWCQFARKNVSHVAEATGFVHFELSFDAELRRRTVSPEHYIVAFANRDKGRQRYHSSLLTMRIVKESEIPQEHPIPQLSAEQASGADTEYLEFELLLRVSEAPVQQQLRITAGPVRTSPETGQRESMRIDLGRCVRQILTEIVDDPRGKRVVRNRWWICVETLRLVCTANALDCSALDEPGKQPVEWVVCLIDERNARPNEAPQQQEERNIDDLVSFISGKAESSKKKKKQKKDKEKKKADEAVDDRPWAFESGVPSLDQESDEEEDPVAQVVAEATGSASGSAGTNSQQLQLEAAVRLLAEAAASCTSPQQAAVAAAAAAAAEAARKAAEAAASGADAAAGQPLRPSAASAAPAAAPARKTAAEYLRALEASAASAAAPAAVPAALQGSQHLPARAPKVSRPLLGGWEPEPSPLFSRKEALAPSAVEQLDVAAALQGADPASRAFGGLAELETLLAGLRSEFAEEHGPTTKRRDGRSAADVLREGGWVP